MKSKLHKKNVLRSFMRRGTKSRIMHYTYILRSTKNPAELYYGFTINLEDRLKRHNAGDVSHTNKNKPWEVIFYAAFETKELAFKFETYLKSASGKAFMKKRLIRSTTIRQT